MRVALRFLLAVVLLPLTAYAIDVSGDQWGTWTRENSPYNVIGEIRVPSGETLTIEPGVVVNFQGHYKFIVDNSATLLAIGTETDSIYFTTDDRLTGWHGIRFYSAHSNSQVSYCVLEYGKAPGEGEDSKGGAIYCHYSSPTLTHNTMRHNTAKNGGGILSYYGSPTISHNYITGNSSNVGGGIRPWGGDPTITNNIIEGNSAAMGGGVFSSYSNATISNNLISHNSASRSEGGSEGGGIYCWNESPEVSFNTIIGNWAGSNGGGIYVHKGLPYPAPMINHNTIYGNSATFGGGIYCRENSSPTIENSILWENTAPSSPEIYRKSGSNLTVRYSDVRGGWEGEGNIDADPLFVNPEAGDFHLQWGSPCIDAGDPESPPDPDGSRADMGAYYFPKVVYSPEEFTFNLLIEASAEKVLSIQNCFSNTALFSLSSDVDWISFSPRRGYILPDSSLDVSVTFDGSGLPLGPNQATIFLEVVTVHGEFDYEIRVMVHIFSTEYTYVSLTPDTLPIIIPPEGGSLSYWAEVYNSSDYTYYFDIWIDVTFPSGWTYGPIHKLEDFRFKRRYSESRYLTQNVPGYAPPGRYYYNAKMGVLPDQVDFQDSFSFRKLPSTSGLAYVCVTSWDLFGWDEESITYLGEDQTETGLIPTEYSLSQNYPNPFNANTVIDYQLPVAGHVKLEVYNTLGQRVATLVNSKQQVGYRSVTWDASEISSGLYFYKLTAGDFTETRRMMLVK